MERFYDEDDDDEPFFGSEDEEEEEEAVAYMDQQGIIDVMQIELAQTELNHQLLDRAIQIAKQGWLWFFKSAEERTKEVEEIYKRLLKLMEKEESEE